MNKVSHGEEQEHDQHPGELAGDHGDVVVRLVHGLLATGHDGTVVPLWAADLLVPANDRSTSADGQNIHGSE